MASITAPEEHHAGGDPGQPLQLQPELIAVVHVHGVGCLMDQHRQTPGAERLPPEAGLIQRQGEHVGATPVGVEGAAAVAVPGELATHPVLTHRTAVHQLLAEPHGELQAAPEAAALEMAVNLVGEIHHPQIAQLRDAGAVVAAAHVEVVAERAIAQLDPARLVGGKGIEGVLQQLLHQVLGRPGGIHGGGGGLVRLTLPDNRRPTRLHAPKLASGTAQRC